MKDEGITGEMTGVDGMGWEGKRRVEKSEPRKGGRGRLGKGREGRG